MRSNGIIILIFILSVIMSSCKTESEKILTERIENENFNFDSLKIRDDFLSYNIDNNIQYGIIKMENDEKVKFWFLTHHLTSDIGGVIYEYPTKEKEFYSGYHCCEVLFFQNGKQNNHFKNLEKFKSFLRTTERVVP